MKLSHKLPLLVLLATVTTGLVLGAWNAHQTQQSLYEDALTQGSVIAQALAETQVARMSERQVVDLTHSLRRIVRDNADIAYLFVTDFDGQLFAHSFDGGFPHEYLHPTPDNRGLKSHLRRLPFGVVLEIDRPIINGLPAHIYVGMHMQRIQDSISAMRWQILSASLLTGILVAMLLYVLARRLIRPISALSELMEDYGQGTHVQHAEGIEKLGSTEIATLYDKFFEMIRDRESIQIELEAERHFIDAIVDESAALILILDPEGRIVRFNPACERVSGYSSEEARGHFVWDLVIPPEEREGVRNKAFFALKHNPEALAGSYTNHWSNRQGDKHLLEWSNSLLRDSHGRMQYMIAVGIDVTDRKQTELELQQFKSTLDHTLDCVFMFDAESLLFFYVNQGAMEQVGYSAEEMLQMHPYDIKPDISEIQFKELIKPLLQGEKSLITFETRHRHRDGHDISVEIALQYIQLADERPRFVAVVRDITERKQKELELRQFKSTLDRTLDCVFMFDAETLRFFYVNQGALEQVGYSAEEMLQMHPHDIKPDLSEIQFKELIKPLLQGEKSLITFETRHRHRDGHDIPVEIALQYIHLDDERPRFVAVVRDITERKKAEAQLQKLNQELENRVEERTRELAQTNVQLTETLNTLQYAQAELVRSEKLASLGSLVAGVAHEMSTPLGNSLMVASTMRDNIRDINRELADESLTQESLEAFLQRTDKAAGLLNTSLMRASEMINHFKQVAVDQTSAKRREFDLEETITEVVETLQPRFKKTPHELRFEPGTVMRLNSFPGPLGQVITNLAINALVHAFDETAKGSVVISTSESDDEHCLIQVSDNGTGIAPEHLSQVFDPFFTTRFGQGGSGLGLHIVYTIVNRVLGGKISIESEPGSGSRFDIEIPLLAPEQANSDRSSDTARPVEENR